MKVITSLKEGRKWRVKSALRRMTKEKARANRRYRRRVKQMAKEEDSDYEPKKSEQLTSWDIS